MPPTGGTLGYLALTALLSVVNWKLGRVHPRPLPRDAVHVLHHGRWSATTTNHLGVWRSKWLNLLTSYVIALFYGHPAVRLGPDAQPGAPQAEQQAR